MNISGIADVIYVLLTANYIGRRYALSIAHLIIGVSCVSMAFIPKEYSNTILALYLVSTVFAGASKYILYRIIILTLLGLMRGYFYSLVIFWLYYKGIYRKIYNLFILSYFFTGFSLVYLMTSELYPTNLRSQAVGFASTISRVFCLCAPFLGHFAKIWEPAPMVLIG